MYLVTKKCMSTLIYYSQYFPLHRSSAIAVVVT